MYVPHELDSVGGRPLDARLNVVASPKLTLGYLVYGADAALTLPPLRHCYHVNLTLTGTTTATRRGGRDRVVTSGLRNGVVLLPSEDSTVSWTPEATQYVMKFPRGSLEEHLGGLLGHPVTDTIDFDVTMDLTRGPGARLSAVRYLQTEIDRPSGLLDAPLAREQVESYVQTALLLGVPNSYSDELSRPTGRDRPAVVRRTMDFVESHVDEVLKRVAPGARGRGHRANPADQLRPISRYEPQRLRARRASRPRARRPCVRVLGGRGGHRAGGPLGVREDGRFSQQYHRKYGELPSVTLRRN